MRVGLGRYPQGMELTEYQYQRIADCLPRQRGDVSMNNLTLLNALLYMVENGCIWRRLRSQFDNWHTIYTRMNRLEQSEDSRPRLRPLANGADTGDSDRAGVSGQPIIKIHPDGTGPRKNGPQAIGRSRGGCPTKIHLVAANARRALMLKLSAGQAGDAPQERGLLEAGGPVPTDWSSYKRSTLLGHLVRRIEENEQ